VSSDRTERDETTAASASPSIQSRANSYALRPHFQCSAEAGLPRDAQSSSERIATPLRFVNCTPRRYRHFNSSSSQQRTRAYSWVLFVVPALASRSVSSARTTVSTGKLRTGRRRSLCFLGGLGLHDRLGDEGGVGAVTGGRALGDEGDRRRGGGPLREPSRGPVRPVYRDDGRGDSRDASAASSAAPLGYSPSEDGPSGPVSRRGVDDLRFGGNRTNIKNILGNGNRPGLGHPRPSASRTMPRARLPERRLASVPALDLRPQPEAGTAAA
jgi:hypothetical protein